ncbi:MAG: polysaccharide deacetylase family protein [Rickettsiaceae bacterium H1]|nr:polysaccharide deacetylase family protein [Rickettsiaceae bacterium H1]
MGNIFKTFIVFTFVFSMAFAHNRTCTTCTVYLTFDDGPLGGTENILSVLEEEQVPASFFMVGKHVGHSEKQKKILEKVRESPYVLLGNHSYSHAFNHYRKFYSNIENVTQDMKKNNEILGLSSDSIFYSRLPGRDVFRLPEMSYDDPFISREERDKEKLVYDRVFAAGFYLYGWDHEWEHKKGEPVQSVEKLVDEIYDYIMSNKTLVHKHLILLMHDQMFGNNQGISKEKLRKLIKCLKKEKYTLANLRQYNLQS